MCDAFAGLGLPVRLMARGQVDQAAAVQRFGLRREFQIEGQTQTEHLIWLMRQRLFRPPGRFYFGRRTASLAWLAAQGLPVALELHQPPRGQARTARLAAMFAARRFRGLVVISDQLRAEIQRLIPDLPPERILVAHDGVPASLIRPPRVALEMTRARAVYCGSLHPGKGMETLLPAAALCPEVDFEVIGGSPEQIDALRPQAPANLRFLGWMTHQEAQAALPGYDIALAPYSRTVRGVRTPEHLSLADWMSPLKIFEYMGAGLPIVCSDLPVLREVLIPDVNACLVPPEDPAALAQAVRELAQNPARRQIMAETAQRHLDGYTWESRARRIADFLTTLPA